MVQTQFPLSGGIKGVKAYNTKKEKKYNVTSKPLCTFSTFWEKFPVEMTLEEQESAGGADIGRSIEELRGGGTGGAEGAIAPQIFLEIGDIVAFSTPNIFISKEGTIPKSH